MAGKNKTKADDAGPLNTKQVTLLEHDRELFAARFSPDGKYLFAGSYDGNVYRWEVGAAKAEKTAFAGHHGWIQGLAFHPDGKRMFTADSWGTISCWNYADAAPKPIWTRDDCSPNWMHSMALSGDGMLLATCGADFHFRLWSAEDGSPKWESPVQETDLQTVLFHPRDGALLVGDLKGNITQWDVPGRKIARKLDAKILYLRPIENGVPEINDVGGVRLMSFSPDAKTLAAGGCHPTSSGFFTGKPSVVLIDWETGKTTQTLEGDGDIGEGMAHDLIWHPDGYLMITCCAQAGKGAIYFWKPGEKAPFYVNKNLNSGRGLSAYVDVEGVRLAMTQVESKGGNGRYVSAADEYKGGSGRVRIFAASKI